MQSLEQLNSAQREAVLHTEGPLLILAGAGAGKTRVIAARIAQIVRQGVAPEQILAVTFTNKAAGEMRERVGAGPFISTFHSLGLFLIKAHHKLLGFKRTPAIYDRADSMRELKKVLKEIGAEDIEPRMALGTISRAKGEGVTAFEFGESASTPYEKQVARAWQLYDRALRAHVAVDFDDLLALAVTLLEEHTDIRKKYVDTWRYLHIDEYQDTNTIQAKLADLLVGTQKNICVVGDEDQTIYTWRGATIDNIQSFEQKYGAKYVLLNVNYRSTKNILQAAKDVITHNRNRKDKHIDTHNPEGALIGFYQAFDETDEAGFVTRIIKEKIAEGKRPRDFAILYRANFQSRALEEQLLAGGVSYQVLGTRFFERKEVKDALSYIRAALYETPADIARASETPRRGIGKVALMKLLRGESAGAKVEMFKQLLIAIKERESEPPAEVLKFVIRESGMEKMYKEDKFEGAERLENLRELVSLASRYGTLQEFTEGAALMSEADELKEERDAVRLMTVHAAKGLEFDTVFVTGLEEGLFPMAREDDKNDPEEERRLMYVAITRAKQKLYVTYASFRTFYGQKNPTIPSSFLRDMPGELLELENPEPLGKTIYLD